VWRIALLGALVVLNLNERRAMIEKLAGTFEGEGVWHDAVGKSMTYMVQQTSRATADGFEIAFKHDFADGSVVDARFQMTWIAAHIFRVSAAGSPLGHGYVFDGSCHYHLETGQAFVEASYRVAGDTVEVLGSSTKNAEGNYIAWREVLRRTT
jgi:hypothetical protein